MTVPTKLKRTAINFLFPKIDESSAEYRQISKFIDSEFAEIRACVMFKFNTDFMELVCKLGLDSEVERKEVIITNGSVLAANDFSHYLREVATCTPFTRQEKRRGRKKQQEKEPETIFF